MYVIRKRIKVAPEQAVFMFVKNVLPPTGEGRRGRRGWRPRTSARTARTSPRSPFLTSISLPSSLSLIHPPTLAALMSDVYDDHKDPDGFLYMTFAGENTFG